MTTSFQDALKTGDLRALRAIPKSDLHNHSIGGGHPPLVSEWAGRDIAPLDRPLASMAEMGEWVEDRLGSLFSGPTGRLRAFEAPFAQAKYAGVTRLEVGEDVWAITLFEHDATKLSFCSTPMTRRLLAGARNFTDGPRRDMAAPSDQSGRQGVSRTPRYVPSHD